MASNKLIPVSIVDRNGKHTTVYRTPEQAPAVRDNIPMVMLGAPTDEQLIDSVMAAYEKSYGWGDKQSSEDKYRLHTTLSSYSKKTVEQLHDVMQDESDPMRKLDAVDLLADRSTEVRVNEYYCFIDRLQERSYNAVCGLLDSLRDYQPELEPHYNYSEASEHVQSQCVALLDTAGTVERSESLRNRDAPLVVMKYLGEGHRTPVLRDAELINLLLDRPEDSDRINDIIRDRDTVEVKVLVEVLDSEVGSLSSGVL